MKRKFSLEALEIIAARFSLLSDASRLELLQQLWQGERTVNELCDLTKLNQANVSKHLGLLARQGLVTKRREGLFVHYSAGDSSSLELCRLAYDSLEKRYKRLARELADE